MALVTHKFKLDLTPGAARQVLYTSQGDIGRPFEADLYWNGSPWTATGTTASIRGKKPDDTVFDYTATVSGSTVTFETTEQMTIISGPVECELVFSNDGDVIASANFVLIVEESPYNPDALSESVIPGIVDLIEDTIGGDVRDEVDALITAHPEWTTTVQDGAITKAKINTEFLPEIENAYVTPQMFGAKGDGTTNDKTAFQNALDYISENGGGVLLIPQGDYDLTPGGLEVSSNTFIFGLGRPRVFTGSATPYFSIFKNKTSILENVSIYGLYFDQLTNAASETQPNNQGSPYCCIAFLGKCTNINISNNIFDAFGGWVVSVTDTNTNYGSSNVKIVNNTINWQHVGNTWYDASSIYAESDGHYIEENAIMCNNNATAVNGRWKVECAIETHGYGCVKNNTIKNAETGINVADYAYNNNGGVGNREISNNRITNASRGLWLWIPTKPRKLKNLSINNNSVVIEANGWYAGYFAIGATMSKTSADIAPYNGGVENVNISKNTFQFVDNTYSGSVYFDYNNVGGITFMAKGTFKDVLIENNTISDFPWPAIVINQWDTAAERYHENIFVINNTFVDCGFGMPNTYQRLLFYANSCKRLYIKKNLIKWVSKNATNYLLQFGDAVTHAMFTKNIQETSNDFTVYSVLSAPNIASVFVDPQNLGYRTTTATPIENLTPKKIGEMVLNTATSKWFISTGNGTNDWYELS